MNRRAFLGAFGGAALAARAQTQTAPGGPVRTVPGQPPPSPGQDDPLGVRSDFPITGGRTYLNSAYITPVPAAVADAGRRFIEAKATGPIPLGEMLAARDEARERFARLIGASREEVGFLYATTEGENIVTRALDLQAGDNIVIDDLHYTSTFVLYSELARRRGIELRIAARREDGAVPVERFAPLVDARTRLVSVAWVSHQNGYRHDVGALAELAHAHGAYLYADAVQAIGMVAVDVRSTGIDFFTCGTYKWLLGGYGVAPFFVRAALLDRIEPDRLGFLQIERELGDREYEFYRSARKFEYATLAFGAVYELRAGLAYLERVGVDRIERHTVGLAGRLHEGLAARGIGMLTPAGNRSSIVSFRNDRDERETLRIFRDAGVEVTVREGGRMVRVAPALFNNAAEIDRFLDVVDTL